MKKKKAFKKIQKIFDESRSIRSVAFTKTVHSDVIHFDMKVRDWDIKEQNKLLRLFEITNSSYNFTYERYAKLG